MQKFAKYLIPQLAIRASSSAIVYCSRTEVPLFLGGGFFFLFVWFFF